MKAAWIFFILLSVVINCSVVFSQGVLVHGGPDLMEGDGIHFSNIEVSAYAKDTSGYDYGPWSAHDWDKKTAWSVHGNGNSQWIKFTYDYEETTTMGKYNRKINVYRIGIINGLAASKDLYLANNRIKKARVDFSNGKSVILEFSDGVLDYQFFYFNVKSEWFKIIILETYKGVKYDDTCISEIRADAWEHPANVSLEIRKNMKDIHNNAKTKWLIDNGGF